MSFNDNYYKDEDIYQGVPIGGYTSMVKNMISDIPIELGVDFNNDVDYWISKAHKVVYTGALDELFNYSNGDLNYRSLRFEHEKINIEDYQGVAVVNHTEDVSHYNSV